MFESGFSDFLQQIPPVIVVMLCGSGILLLISVAAIFTARIRRSAATMPLTEPSVASYMNTGLGSYGIEAASGGDLPDLDLLLGGAPAPKNTSAPARRTGTFSVTLVDGRSVDVAEVLTVTRDLTDGQLVVVIGGQAYRSAAEMSDVETKRRFANVVRELARIATDAARASESGVPTATSAPPTPPASIEPPVAPPAVAPSAPAGTLPGDLPKFSTDTPLQITKPKRGTPKPEVPELNIADAIEAYLQYKLARTPAFDGRRIHVLPSVSGGVTIEVDGRYFDAVDEVDDATVREFLRTTIEEWQSRQ